MWKGDRVDEYLHPYIHYNINNSRMVNRGEETTLLERPMVWSIIFLKKYHQD